MAGIPAEVFQMIKDIAEDVATIKQIVAPLPDIYKDMYLGDEANPPMITTCRAYQAEKKRQETAVTVALSDKKDLSTKVKLQLIGAGIALLFCRDGIIAFVGWVQKLITN